MCLMGECALKRTCRDFDEISSLAAPEVVILTTSSVASDEHVVTVTTLLFQCVRICWKKTGYHCWLYCVRGNL